MASTSSKEASPRRLAELLDEQQEPFVLELYLLERGHRIRRSLELDTTSFGCCSAIIHDHDKSSKKSVSMKSSTRFTLMAKTILSKLVSRRKPARKRTGKEAVGSSGRCYSFSCSTTLSSSPWSDSDTEEEIVSMPSSRIQKSTNHNERDMDQWRLVEDNKQCSPDSVLDEIDLLQGIPLYKNARRREVENSPAESRTGFQKKLTGDDAILPASLWELLLQFTKEKPRQRGRRKPFPGYMNSKKAFQKNGLLVFDCVREAVENGNQLKDCFRNREDGLNIGQEHIEKNICKKPRVWRRLSVVGEAIVEMVLRGDLFEGGVAREWSSFELWKGDIAKEIGDGIVDDITDEIIRDMMSN